MVLNRYTWYISLSHSYYKELKPYWVLYSNS